LTPSVKRLSEKFGREGGGGKEECRLQTLGTLFEKKKKNSIKGGAIKEEGPTSENRDFLDSPAREAGPPCTEPGKIKRLVVRCAIV